MRALTVLAAGFAAFLVSTLAIVMLMLVVGGFVGGESVAWMNWPGFAVSLLLGGVAAGLAWYAGKPRVNPVVVRSPREERHIRA